MIPFYYKVGDKVFYNNIHAMQYASKHNLQPSFHISTIWDGPHWRREPSHSVQYYMDKLSLELSRRYDNIVLLYSGGTDSHTILSSFIRCGIRNVYLSYENSPNHKDDYARKRFNQLTLKSLKEYKQIFNTLNYTVLDPLETNNFMPDIKLSDFEQTLETFKGSYETGILASAGMGKYTQTPIHYPGNGKTAIIYGYEKPHIEIKNEYYCWRSSDLLVDYGNAVTNGTTDIIFYYYSDLVPELQVKLSYKCIEIIEKLLKQENLTPNKENVEHIKHKYYEQINDYMGYSALNPLLNSTLSKRGALKGASDKNVRKSRLEDGTFYVLQDFYDNVCKSINNNYCYEKIFMDSNLIVGTFETICTPHIPIRKVYK